MTALCDQLGLKGSDDVAKVLTALQAQRRLTAAGGRAGPRRALRTPGASGCDLRQVARPRRSGKVEGGSRVERGRSGGTPGGDKTTPEYETYEQRRVDREKQEADAEQNELKLVKYRRLVDTLESIVLARNLPMAASPEIQQGFAKMKQLERTSLKP